MKLFGIGVAIILLLTLTPLVVDGDSVNVSQTPTTFRYQLNNQVASGLVTIGNTTDSQFGMLSSKITTTNSMIKIVGTPLVEEINPFRVNVSGTFAKDVSVNSKVIGTYFEVDDYLPQYNELERYKISDNRQYVESDEDFETSFDFLRHRYDLFKKDESYRIEENQRSGVTAFIRRNGFIKNIILNDTDGNEMGQIFSFRVTINIFFFNTGNQKFMGVYQTKDFGYGNILPESVISYLKSNEFRRELAGGSIGKKLFDDYRFSNIEWIDLGYNSSLGLDIYKGVYFFSRESTSVWSRSGGNRQTLQLNQIDDEFEQFQNELIDTNLVDAFSDDILSAFEEQLSQEVLDTSGITVTSYIYVDTDGNKETNKIPNLSNLYNEKNIFIAQLSALLFVTFVLIRRKNNS